MNNENINMDNWYKGEYWDAETQKQFEQKLKKSRGSYNKAQYLRIKGSSLLNSQDPKKRVEGGKLLKRVIQEYPKEISSVIFAYEQLGDYYFHEKKYEEAEFNYRQSVSFYNKDGRSGASGIGDIKLAETIVATKQSSKYDEMYHLLIEEFKKNDGSLLLNEDIFRYYSVLAKLCDGLGKSDLDKEYAKKALEILEIKEPQLDKYPKLGIIKIDKTELDNLKEIIIK
jgi:tetratricopeptide (TPR) repeat protein